jgi:hypothetical protein
MRGDAMPETILRRLAWAALILVILPRPAAAATEPGDSSITTSVGFVDSPSGDYESDHGYEISLEYNKTSTVALRGSLGLYTLEGRANSSPPGAGAIAVEGWVASGSLQWSPHWAMLHPFVRAGAGLYDIERTDDAGSSGSVEIGVHWGVGLDIQLLRHFALRGEGSWHYVTGDTSNPVTVYSVGGRFIF